MWAQLKVNINILLGLGIKCCERNYISMAAEDITQEKNPQTNQKRRRTEGQRPKLRVDGM